MGCFFSHFFVPFVLFVFLGCLQAALGERVLITGKVFCDQCSDGYLNKTDYPLDGMEVTVSCFNPNGQGGVEEKNITMDSGMYTVWFDSKVEACIAHVSKKNKSMACGQNDTSASKKARFVNSTNGVDTYLVDTLFSYPWDAPFICQQCPPMARHTTVMEPASPSNIVPTTEIAAACSYRMWAMPDHKCQWKVLPETKVVDTFGEGAARRYGPKMTLWEGIQGNSDIYGILSREAITALLNSYSEILFIYTPLEVMHLMNSALMGSERDAIQVSTLFKKANSGNGCGLTPCSS